MRCDRVASRGVKFRGRSSLGFRALCVCHTQNPGLVIERFSAECGASAGSLYSSGSFAEVADPSIWLLNFLKKPLNLLNVNWFSFMDFHRILIGSSRVHTWGVVIMGTQLREPAPNKVCCR